MFTGTPSEKLRLANDLGEQQPRVHLGFLLLQLLLSSQALSLSFLLAKS